MPTSNIVEINEFRQPQQPASQQEIVDDIGARAFVAMRNEAEAAGIPVKTVLVEHMLGLAMVIEAVESSEEARRILAEIESKLSR